MTKTIRSLAVLASVVCMAGSMSFAQAGAATYKAKCQMCHGANGAADTPTAKMLKVPPVSSPEMKKMSEAEMVTATTDGKGKMPAFKSKLTEPEIKDAVAYFRSLK